MSATVQIARVAQYADVSALGAAVRGALALSPGLAAWLGEAARLVVVKPNWIQESHQHEPDTWEPVITHPAVVEAALRVLAEAMQGRGVLALCDAPHTYANFDAILARGGLRDRLDGVRRDFPGVALELIDLRREVWVTRDDVIVSRTPNPADPRGYTRVDLARHSLFYRHHGEGRFYGADYDSAGLNSHHRGELHEYLLAGTPMRCDLFVNLPKLKTHKKTGLTCSLKNLVGINGDKNWLPHHTEGAPQNGGDEFPRESAASRLERTLKRAGRRAALAIPVLGPAAFRHVRAAGKAVLGDSDTVVRNGNWHGNDTCWRMALDLNRAFLYGDSEGALHGQRRRYLTIVDGIIAGEGNGPIAPNAVTAGVLIASTDPAAADATAARLMGYRIDDIPIVRHAFEAHEYAIASAAQQEIRIADARDDREYDLESLPNALGRPFTPHFGWTALVEPAHGS